jgi:hypothetical protein
MTNREAGLKANETKLAKFGADEPNRAGRHAAFTAKYGRDLKNPHTRENTYPVDEVPRWKNFDTWRKAHPNHSMWENPFRHPHWDKEKDPAFVAKQLLERRPGSRERQ